MAASLAATKPWRLCSNRRSTGAVLNKAQPRLAVRISAQKGPLASVDDDNVNPYCSLDDQGRRTGPMTLGEKEQMFLEALSSYYFEGKSKLSDEEFENLKDELIWNGSTVAVLNGDEQMFLEAQLAFNRGKPLMSDAEFDALKQRLRQEGSMVTLAGPRCNISSRRMYSDAQVDYLKMTALNLPAAVLVLAGVFSIDDLTGFEITKLIELPAPWGIVILWGFLLPAVYVLAASLTDLIFKDALILKGPCPSCGTENTVYFGDILTIGGTRKKGSTQCSNCKSPLEFDANTREVVVVEGKGAEAA